MPAHTEHSLSAQRLTALLIGALVLIALVSLVSFMVLYASSGQQTADANLIATAGRQRTLGAQIGIVAERIAETSDPEIRATFRFTLETLLQRLRLIQASLVEGNSDLGIPPPSDSVRKALMDAQPTYERLLIAAERFVAADAEPAVLLNALAELDAYRSLYLARMEVVVLVYEREATLKVEQARQQNLIMVAVNGVLLILIGLLVFRPMVRQINATIAALQASEARADEAARELARQNARLDLALLDTRAASSARERFLTAMNREIRTPLNAVIGMSDLLRETTLTPEQREYVETIRSSSDTLLAITNDVLDFTQIDAGRVVLNRQPFSITACVETVLERLAFRAARKRIDLLYSAPAGLPAALIGDEARLRQILTNLVDNAIRHTDRGEVEIGLHGQMVSPETYELQISVRDTGSGIAPDRIASMFEGFRPEEATALHPYGGLGLGLAISRRLCELMGGRLTVSSTPGEGATFLVVVQLGWKPSSIAQAADDTAQLHGRRILILDDNAAMLRVLHDLLTSLGAVVTTVSDSAALLQALVQHDFDLALLDLSLPEMSGGALINELQARKAALPIVLMAFTGDEGVWRYTQQAAIAAVLFKPVTSVQLRATLRRALQPQSGRDSRRNNGAARSAPFLGPALRILLAEDNLSNQKVAQRMLERLGYHADIVEHGEAALAALQRRDYDVVLMDVQMPHMDGIEATRRIMAEVPADRRPWIIAMTASAMPGDREAYLEAGMADYISKPVQFSDLISALVRVPPLQLPDEWFQRPSAPLLDPERVGMLREALGQDVLNDLIVHYMQEAPALIANMRRTFEQVDQKGFHRAAHTLKASSAMFGAMGLSQVCAELERRSKQSMPDNVAEQLGRADQLLGEVGTWLANYRTN